MQLTEAEIVAILRAHEREYEYDNAVTGQYGAWTAVDIEPAAHAIAEKMREGLVWQWKGTGRTWIGPMTGLKYLEVKLNDGRYLIDKPMEFSGELDGQRVRVTVTKLEGEDADKTSG